MVVPRGLPVTFSQMDDRSRQAAAGAPHSQPRPRRAGLGKGKCRQPAYRNAPVGQLMQQESQQQRRAGDHEDLPVVHESRTVAGGSGTFCLATDLVVAKAAAHCAGWLQTRSPRPVPVAYNRLSGYRIRAAIETTIGSSPI